MYLASTCGNLKDVISRDRYYTRALRYAGQATERERLYIKARYAYIVEAEEAEYERLLRKLIGEYPKEKRALFWLAKVALRDEQYQEALELLSRALSLDPDYTPALNQIAYVYFIGMDEYEKALEYLKRYAAASPGDANPFDSMGELYFRMGDLKSSIARYREAVKMKPDFYSSIKNLAYVYGAAGKPDSSLIWINRYIDTVPNEELRMFGFGWRSVYLFYTGQYQRAYSDVERWDRISREGSRINTSAQKYLMGWYLLLNGRYREAERKFREWYGHGEGVRSGISDCLEAWGLICTAFIDARRGRISQAERGISGSRTIHQHSPCSEDPPLISPFSCPIYTLTRAEVFLADGKYRRAVNLMREEHQYQIPHMNRDTELMNHNIPPDGDVAARAYAALGEMEKAADEYISLIRFDPKGRDRRIRYPLYHYRLGKIFQEMGRKSEAAAQLREFLQYWKDADEDLQLLKDARRRLNELEP